MATIAIEFDPLERNTVVLNDTSTASFGLFVGDSVTEAPFTVTPATSVSSVTVPETVTLLSLVQSSAVGLVTLRVGPPISTTMSVPACILNVNLPNVVLEPLT